MGVKDKKPEIVVFTRPNGLVNVSMRVHDMQNEFTQIPHFLVVLPGK